MAWTNLLCRVQLDYGRLKLGADTIVLDTATGQPLAALLRANRVTSGFDATLLGVETQSESRLKGTGEN